MPAIQKIHDAQALLEIGEVQTILSILNGGIELSKQIPALIGQFANIYNEDTATWAPWCNTNLGAAEKNQLLQAMQRAKLVQDYFNS